MFFLEKFYVIGRFEKTKSFFIEKQKSTCTSGFNIAYYGKHICTFEKKTGCAGYYLSLAADNMESTFDFYNGFADRYFNSIIGEPIEIHKHYVQ